jgi:hypothetical protein
VAINNNNQRFEFLHEKFVKGRPELLSELHPRRPARDPIIANKPIYEVATNNQQLLSQSTATVSFTTQLSNWLERDAHLRSLINAHMNELNQLLDASGNVKLIPFLIVLSID